MSRTVPLGLLFSCCVAFLANADSLPRVRVSSVNASGRATFVEGRLAVVELPADDGALSRAARQVAPLFRIDGETIELERVKRDDVGITHARFRQVAYGIEVVGGDFLVHVDRDGIVFAASSAARDQAIPPPDPRIDAAAATRIALETRAGDAAAPRLTYVITTRDQSLYLAWEVLVSGADDKGPFLDAIYVDACGGTVVDVRPRMLPLLQRRIYSMAYDYYLPGSLLRGEGSAPSNDALANTDYDHWGRVYQCFESLFRRNSYNDQGATIVSSIHFGTAKNNAFWNGTQFLWCDGDGKDFLNLALAYDVHAHEFMHAVTQYESHLAYSNEPGALNESLSDVMAAACDELYPPDPPYAADPWKIMETVYTPGTPGDAYRYLNDPSKDGQSSDFYPERYRGIDDNGGVHLNSGIGNLAFYLLANGGTHPQHKTTFVVPGIGLENAAKIFYRANDYITSGASFSDMRSATITAASALNMTSDTANAVRQAWAAVGVGNPVPPDPQPIVLPAAPTFLSARATAPGQIDLTWQDNSTVETGFKIERRTGAGAYAEIDRTGANATGYSNGGLAASTTYAYRVRAYNGSGSSSYSNEASATTPGVIVGAPAAPTGLRGVAVTSSSIELTWVHEGSDEEGFIIERGLKATSMAEVQRVGANILKAVSTGMVERTAYLFRVRAYNKAGISGPSNLIEVETLADMRGCCSSHGGVCDCQGNTVICCDKTVSPTCSCEWLRPSAPTDLTARTTSGRSVVLSWRDTSANETAFSIERSKNGPFLGVGVVGANTTSYVDNTAAQSAPRYDQPTGTMISYRVRACKAAFCSDPSNIVSIATDCRGTVLPTESEISAAGGRGAFTISVFGACSWGATSQQPGWIRLRNDRGVGGGVVEYDVLPNIGPPRTGYISALTGHPLMVGFLMHEVRQGGGAATLPPPPSLGHRPLAGGGLELTWGNSGIGAAYVVERRDVCDDTYTPLASTTSTRYVDSSRAEGVQYVYRVRAIGNGVESEYSNVTPRQGVGGACTGGSLGNSTLTSPQASTSQQAGGGASSFRLEELIPAQLASTSRRSNPPRNVIGATNAVEVAGFDYISDSSGLAVAAVAAFRSAGTAYANDYGAWARYKGGRLTRVEPVALRPAGDDVWFWRAHIENGERAAEWGMTFAVFVDPSEWSFTVDSEWTADAYRKNHKGDVLTFQVWSDSEATTSALVLEILRNLATRATVIYDNRREPPGTLVFASNASYTEPDIVIGVTNASESPRLLNFTITGYPAASTALERRHVVSQTVPPGESVVKLPMPDIASAFITLDDGVDFADSLFVADGRWIALESAPRPAVVYDAENCTAAESLIAVDRHVSGCAHVQGTLQSGEQAGFSRTLEVPGRRDVDASRWPSLTFFARGDGNTYRMAIDTDKARIYSAPFHAISFTAPPEGRQIVVPLSLFEQPAGTPDALRFPLTGAGIRALSWSASNNASGSVDLTIDHIAFTGSVFINGTTVLPDTGARGPYRVTARVTDEVEVSEVNLAWRIGRTGPFTRIAMTAAGSDPALFTADIPAAAPGSQISYYVEATDDSGNIATSPFNAPYTTWEFRVQGGRHRAVRK